MEIAEFLSKYDKHPLLPKLNELNKSEKHIWLKGLCESLRSVFFSAYFSKFHENILFILGDDEEAAYFYNDLRQLLGKEATDVLFLPSSYKRAIKYGEKDSANSSQRAESLNLIQHADAGLMIVTYPQALVEKVISSASLAEKTLTLSVGQRIKMSAVSLSLLNFGFQRQDYVYEPGQFSIRGSIVDVFSFASEYPYRIDFFGDEIDTIRTFNVESQLSIDKQQKVSVVSKVDDAPQDAVPLFDFIPKDMLVVTDDYDGLLEAAKKLSDESQNILSSEDVESGIRKFSHLEMSLHNHFKTAKHLNFDAVPQPVFDKNFDRVFQDFQEKTDKQYQVYVMADDEHQTDRLKTIAESQNKKANFIPVLNTVHKGYVDNDMKICVYTDHQIFNRFHKYTLASERVRQDHAATMLKTLQNMEIGDLVAHIDYGIGKFGGLMTMDIQGRKQEVIKLIYRDDDLVFISIHSLHKISKYKPKETEMPHLSKLGTGAWQALKERTKKKVKDIAKDLILLYSRRRDEKGFAFSPDSFMQSELETSFLYEDTPDQSKATADVKRDMEKDTPMDRLICGDVGFGKTEVAIRSAFKAVADNKQVAVLVPTTVLAFQHFQTFSERLRNFPCRIDYLCRTRSAKDSKQVIEDIANGKINIIIGTHKLIGKTVKFQDLGLLIVDEEQKFGVSVKEKIRQMKVNVDTLTLTATPIPRTLQFSLMGARDLSVIKTPPPNRYPVQTQLTVFNNDVIRDAIKFELERNGQVFFINNRISTLEAMKSLINTLVPEARVVIGHGRMDGDQLEKVILDFLNYDYDVLLSTSIVESGIDISNCNTMIVNDAQNFGLSDLHQLRGRVGRSNRRAFCYLLSPPLTSLPEDSRRRLETIANFSDLGSGFNIAMQDLDIRGAGNLLGAEQSGFIADLGYETYYKILNEAVSELKETELAGDLGGEDKEESDNAYYVSDCQMETDLEVLIPADYVENVSERMNLYRELDSIPDEKSLQKFEADLKDRFGALPEATQNLLKLIRLRRQCIALGFEKCILKNGYLICHFTHQGDGYFKSKVFGRIIEYVSNHAAFSVFNAKNPQKLSVRFMDVKTLDRALQILVDCYGSVVEIIQTNSFL